MSTAKLNLLSIQIIKVFLARKKFSDEASLPMRKAWFR